MRSLILILSLLMIFQPVSWATGTLLSENQHTSGSMQMDHTSPHLMRHTTASVDEHFKQIDINRHEQHQSQLADCLLKCHFACVSADAVTPVNSISFSQQMIYVAYHAPQHSFDSHTESPEVRPPLDILL